MSLPKIATLLLLLLFTVSTSAYCGEDSWLIGKWELIYDPENAEKDWLEFLPSGDVYNIWSDGTRVTGIYILTPEGVKAVFTIDDKDLIATFHADKTRKLLKIVTSDSGKESLYRKVETHSDK